jgi:bifunctional DNA-binding transcriptional regulator/antitoxin component of YhaV-PrlF toxin-antitoxin module
MRSRAWRAFRRRSQGLPAIRLTAWVQVRSPVGNARVSAGELGTLIANLLLMPKRVKRRRGFTRLSPKRQITLPLAVVERAGIRVGEELAVEADANGRVIVSRPGGETVGDRRRRALDRAAGALPGVWPPGALDELRDEWR